MQTLQTARLTTKPVIATATPSSSSTFSAIHRAYDSSNRPPIVRSGILRHRVSNPVQDEPHHLDSDPKTVELITRFFVSQGLPLESAQDPAFKELIKHLNNTCVVPPTNVMSKLVERLVGSTKPLVNYQKTVGPLSVTIDVAGNDDEKYVAFSIHYFDDLYERKNIVYLRKLLVSVLDTENLLVTIRRAVNSYSYSNVKFTNMVCPDEDTYKLVVNSGVIKHYFVCFYHYISRFVTEILKIEEYSKGLNQLRTFIRFIKKHSDMYIKFRRMQLSKNADLDVPSIDDGDWERTAIFLTKCLVLHDTFTEFCEKAHLAMYIDNETCSHLIYLQRLIMQCLKHCKEMSGSNNSISQVIPTIMSLRNFISTSPFPSRFEARIRESFDDVFYNITNTSASKLYDCAALMDPRFAYRENIYSLTTWKSLEKIITTEFVEADGNLEKSFYQDISLLNKTQRYEIIVKELGIYRSISFVDRPEDTDSPNHWWGRHQTDMEFLAVLAREHLASPAVSIDASYHFCNGGKFEHLCHTYPYAHLEGCLSLAGSYQSFRGRGAVTDNITPSMLDTLSNIANRIQKMFHDPRAAERLALEREIADVQAQRYGIPQNLITDLPKVPKPEEKPSVSPAAQSFRNVQSASVATRTVVQAKPVQLNGLNLSAVPKYAQKPHMKPVPIRQVPLQVKPLPPQPKPASIQLKSPILQQQLVQKVSQQKPSMPPRTGEEKPKELLEKEIKKEVDESMVEKVKEEPLDEEDAFQNATNCAPSSKVTPKVVPCQNTALQKKVLIIAKPTMPHLTPQVSSSSLQAKPSSQPVAGRDQPNSTSSPQHIQSHNFVQKFAQKQNFVQKFALKPQGTVGQLSICGRTATKVPFEEKATHSLISTQTKIQKEDVKMESFEEFDLEEEIGDMVETPGLVYREALNERSAANAFARHRANVEYQKRRACNRRCAVCNNLEVHERLKNVTIENEKLLIMLGCIYQNKITVAGAQEFMHRETKTYICRVHFGQTLDEIHRMLNIKSIDEIMTCNLDSMSNVLITVSALRPHITAQSLRKMMYDFADRNKHLTEPPEEVRRGADMIEPLHHPDNDVDDHEIIPKHFRQPRKQVLEEDQHDATVKVIEQEDFKLPSATSDKNEECDNPGICCFCTKRGCRSGMLRVPKSEDRLARWIEKLGPQFEARLSQKEDNLICRDHFPETAFSSRGRLLKGMIPISDPEKVVSTYRIEDNGFRKLNEQKSGTDKNPSINLANVRGGRCRGYVGEEEEEDSSRSPSEIPNHEDHKLRNKKITRKSPPVKRKYGTRRNQATDDDLDSSDEEYEMIEKRTTQTSSGRRVGRPRNSAKRSISMESGADLVSNDTDYKPSSSVRIPKRAGKRSEGKMEGTPEYSGENKKTGVTSTGIGRGMLKQGESGSFSEYSDEDIEDEEEEEPVPKKKKILTRGSSGRFVKKT